jgi:malonate decarboxylase delta subunit
MEHLSFTFESGGRHVRGSAPYALVGVVASGNLEVLVERGEGGAGCAVEVDTNRPGFAETWQAVLARFAEEYDLSGFRISIHDAGAVPAVATLRLHQAVEELAEEPDEE